MKQDTKAIDGSTRRLLLSIYLAGMLLAGGRSGFLLVYVAVGARVRAMADRFRDEILDYDPVQTILLCRHPPRCSRSDSCDRAGTVTLTLM